MSFLQWLDPVRGRAAGEVPRRARARARPLRRGGPGAHAGARVGADVAVPLVRARRRTDAGGQRRSCSAASTTATRCWRRSGAAMKARLDRLTAATQGRQQAVADLARDLRFHYFDEPPMEAAAAELLAEMAAHLAAPGAATRTAPTARRASTRLVWCPQPMRPLLRGHLAQRRAASPALRRLVLEVHIRRYYRNCRLGDIAFGDAGGLVYAAADCTHRRRRRPPGRRLPAARPAAGVVGRARPPSGRRGAGHARRGRPGDLARRRAADIADDGKPGRRDR